MSKKVTKKRIRAIFAIILTTLMLVGIFSCFSVLADGVSAEESTTDSEGDNTEDTSCLVLRADDIINKLYDPNATAAELVERDGISVVNLAITQETNDAFINVDLKGYSASRYVVVLARADINEFTNFSVYYHTSARGDESMKLNEDARAASSYSFGNGWQFLEFDLGNAPGWGGSIYKFRLDYLENGNFAVGEKCEIAAIILSDDAKAVHETAYDLMKEIYSPTQTISDFKESDIPFFVSDRYHALPVSTRVDVIGESLVYRAEGPYTDPQATFDYLGYAEAHGLQALTTDDFRYTVIRYRAPAISESAMELFTLTGDAESLHDMIRIDGEYVCHSAQVQYPGANAWSAMVLDMAEDDGLDNTALQYGWYRQDGNRTFKGFRVDWCVVGFEECYMEISDFIFYQDEAAARGMAFALSSLTTGNNLSWDSEWDPEPDETFGEEDQTFEDILPPWDDPEETTAQEMTEETIPKYENTEEKLPEESTEEASKDTAEATTEATTEETTEETTEDSSDESNSDNGEENSKHEIPIKPGGVGGTGDVPTDNGSEMPFYIACGSLGALSIASVATVVTIKAKEKRTK